ncbi:MAG: hypothetical protein M3O01_00420 [Pseudomonadota bacterium]|nr:hypothetical protein [Pseudomonadota bacterium]
MFGISLLSIHFLSACGGGGCSAIQARTPSTSISQALAAGEASGSLPTQDRDDTIAGTDADGYGIRDDIDRYINTLPDSEREKNALRQKAAALQATLVEDISNDVIRARVSREIMKSTDCITTVYNGSDRKGYKRGSELQKLTVNTPQRLRAYARFNQAMSGSVTKMPEGNNCAR